jgi:hypothetical protein
LSTEHACSLRPEGAGHHGFGQVRCFSNSLPFASSANPLPAGDRRRYVHGNKMTDKAHTILDKPHEYDVVYMEWNINPYDYKESHLILHLQKGEEIKKLKFIRPTEVEIEKGFNGVNCSGMEIIDIKDRQLDNINIQVRNFEQDAGITFMALDVIEI